VSTHTATDRDPGFAGVPETAPRPATARRWWGPAALVVTAIAVLVAPLALAVAITASATVPGPATARVVSAAELEEQYGIKVDLVAVIAAGGVIDVRYQIVDKDKAGHLLHDAPPALYVEASGAVLRSNASKSHKMTIVDGASYFLLYPNSGGVIQAGTQVSVVIDQVRLAPITAQS